MLSIREVAELRGCSTRYIQQLVKDKKLVAVEITNERNRPQLMIPITELEPQLQARWHKEKASAPTACPQPPAQPKPLDRYTAEERKEITFWMEILDKWQQYRNAPGVKSKAVVDEKFVLLQELENPGVDISVSILYRKMAAYREKDYDGLLDKRGKWRKGKTNMPEELWQAFLTFYLDEAQHPIARCIDYTRMWAQEKRPELVSQMPSYNTFRRRVYSEVSEPVRVMGREGGKAYYDRCSLYVKRTYEDMACNDWWVADNHTFDIQTQGVNGGIHRLHLTAFFDARSGIFTGCHVTDNPCSQSTLIALRKGIMQYGIPRNIYVDNGSEFLTFDIGGRGHRSRKSTRDQFAPPPVFKRLGIEMTNAIVRNARAKIIERRFRDVKDHLSRLFDTFTGGNVLERPDRLKGILKNGQIPTDVELTEVVELLMEYYFNEQEYHGEVAADRGMKRIDVYYKRRGAVRMASDEELNLMLMRSSRKQKVGRRGVFLNIAGCRIDYINQELRTMMGKEVYLRYDPEDLSYVRVYDLEDSFIMEVPQDNTLTLSYNASKDDVKLAMREIRKAERQAKEAKENAILPVHERKTALELVLAQAGVAKNARILPESAKAIELHRADEKPLLAVGSDIDLSRMIRNAEKQDE